MANVANEGVPYPDILAKYAAAFFKISRSSVTHFSSAFRRFISAYWSSAFYRSAGGALYRFTHWYRLCELTPNRAATSVAG
jgi:hypothetical protein